MMSRNLRRRSTGTLPPAKTVSRQSSSNTNNASDEDDDYAAVDLISDSEEDEPDVEVAEEQAIIESAEDDDDDVHNKHNVLRPYDFPDDSSWNGFDDVLGGSEAYFEDHIARGYATDSLTHAAALHASTTASSDDDPPRRVRFDLADDSDSDDEDDLFPDIFLAQNDLDPNFRRAIESTEGNDDHVGSSEDGSYWDYREEERRITDLGAVEEDAASTGSSGYETDEGETTEEDLPNVAKYVPARTVLRPSTPQPDAAESESESEEEVPIRRSYNVRGPRLGSWIHDYRRPFVAYDKSGQKLIVFNSGRRHSQPSTTQTSPIMGGDLDLRVLDQSPMISNSGNLMMSAMYGHSGNYIGALGPPEAFVPFTSIAADGTIFQESLSSYDEEDVSDDDMLNVNDFLNFGDDSSEDEQDNERAAREVDSGSINGEPPSTPAPPKFSSEDQVHPLLEHFDGGVVGAFRRNQTRHQLITRNAATDESLAFHGPFGQGTIRGFKANRLGAANTPITPNRKQNFGLMGNGRLAGQEDAAMKKRKFSSGVEAFGHGHGHKRTRSAF